jgi:hypothetical protein
MPYTTALFLFGAIAGYLAFIVGKWRQTCLFWMAENRANVPMGWHKPAIPVGSLILVVVLSITFATSWALLVGTLAGELLGLFAWGVLLAARWYASQVAAFASGQKEKKQIEIDIATRNAERESSRLDDIPDYKGPRDPKVRQRLRDYLQKCVAKRSPSLRSARPNQAMQRTAGRSEFWLSMTSTFNLQPRALSPAVADLGSR